MAIYYREVDNNIIISGKTYPYKELIKSFGGNFQRVDKVWTIPSHPDTLAKIQNLCKSVGGGPLRSPSPKAVASQVRTCDDTPKKQERASLGMSISELMHQVSLEIQTAFPRAVWILGEIQSLNHRASGYFFQIADSKENGSKSATITANVTFWASNVSSIQKKIKSPLNDLLQEGLKVRLLVQVGFYKDRGILSLNVVDIDPQFTQGALALAREELLKELRSKGLDRKNKALPGTLFPFLIGLLSAENSRAQSDFLDQLKSYGFPGSVLFHPVQMQGENTVEAITTGVRQLVAAQCDYIVITRGGGSNADLRWFDDRKIALAIAQSKVPIIAAIGHHEDICVAEEIAYRREKTPTAAADFIMSCFAQVTERINKARNLIVQLAQRRWSQEQKRMLTLADKLRTDFRQQLSMQNEKTQQISARLHAAGAHRLNRSMHKISQLQYNLQNIAQSQVSYQIKRTILCEAQFQRGVQLHLREHQTLAQRLQYQLRLRSSEQLAKSAHQLQKLEHAIASRDPRPWLAKGWTQLVQNGTKITRSNQLDPGKLIYAQLLDAQLLLKLHAIKREDDHG